LKVVISAYACEPDKGSEPGVGWNVAREMAKQHDVWVLTRANNRPAIEAELARNPVPSLRFAYYDLPGWARWWKRGGRGVQLYYYLWQLGVYRVAQRLHQEVGFDLGHHVTFGKYWSPSLIFLLDVPFVWGSVGGGEDIPVVFRKKLTLTQWWFESKRDIARWLGEHDPLVRSTARHSAIALATTAETGKRLERLGCKAISIEPQVAMTTDQFQQLANLMRSHHEETRFISIGRPLHWKGTDLGLLAFAEARVSRSEYWLIANGPERQTLERLVSQLDIERRVRFIDRLPTLDEVYERLAECDVLVHPALHEAFGNVVLEAMAAGKPVICLDLGGPAVQVTPETGFKIAARHPAQAVSDMVEAMRRLAEDDGLRQRMGEAGRRRVREEFSWERKGEVLSGYYEEAIRERA